MEEIRAGEYVRWKGGSIRKVTRLLTSDETYIEIDGLGDIATYKWEMLKNMITKHSSNIIDLIEVGDYVNGYKVTRIYEDIEKFVQCDYPVEAGSTNHYKFYNMAIESIVTREQFENAEYKIKD